MGERQVTKLAFYGPASSGKTWSANYLVQNHNFVRVAFADKLKEIASDLFHVTGKNGADRKVLQDLGQKMREIQPDVWVDYLLNTVNEYEGTLNRWQFKDNPTGIVLDDLRYVNESIALRNAGFKLVYVSTPQETLEWRRSSLYPDTPLSSYYHDSETEWKGIEPDYSVPGGDPFWGAAQLDILMSILEAEHGIRTSV